MASKVQSNFRHRTNLGMVEPIVEIPNLIDIQKSSYDKFLQTDIAPRERKEIGLEAVFRSVFPIKDFDGTSELVYVSYNLEKPKYDVDECRQRGMTFAAPIKVTTQLMVYEIREGGGERLVRDIKEQEVYFGEIPLMTETGTFIINGTERVVVSQLHRRADQLLFSGAHIYHPTEVRKQILAQVKRLRKEAGRAGRPDVGAFLALLSRMAFKFERYRNVRLEPIYDFSPGALAMTPRPPPKV